MWNPNAMQALCIVLCAAAVIPQAASQTLLELVTASSPYTSLGRPAKEGSGWWYFAGWAGVPAQAMLAVPTTDDFMLVDFPIGAPHYTPDLTNPTYTNNMGYWSASDNTYGAVPGLWPNKACGAYLNTPNGTGMLYSGHSAMPSGCSRDACIHPQALNLTHQADFRAGRPYYVSATRPPGFLAPGIDPSPPRWYPSVVTLPDGNHYVFQGAFTIYDTLCNKQYGAFVWNTKRGGWIPYALPEGGQSRLWRAGNSSNAMTQGGCYPALYVLPTGHMINIDHKVVAVYDYVLGRDVSVPPGPFPADLMNSNWTFVFPFSGAVQMLNVPPYSPGSPYTLDFVIFGGGYQDAHARFRFPRGPNALAADFSLRISLTITTSSPASTIINGKVSLSCPAGSALIFGLCASYSWSDWTREQMEGPRLMPDAVILPTNDVLIINGARRGSARQMANQSNDPVMVPMIYRPSKPAGFRFTNMANTTIPRLYHSNAQITPFGDILVAGCTTCSYSFFKTADYAITSQNPYPGPEYRVERFMPPHKWQPIQPYLPPGAAPGTLYYNIAFQMAYTFSNGDPGALDVTKVVMRNVGGSTHGVHFQVANYELNFEVVSPGQLVVYSPIDQYWAVPAMYHIYVVCSTGGAWDVYSNGLWVQLSDDMTKKGTAQVSLRK